LFKTGSQRLDTLGVMDEPTLRRLFPAADAIPEDFLPGPQLRQRTWLAGGALREWDEPFQTVMSPVCVRLPDGSLQQVELGSYPLLAEAQSDEALEAAVAAYDSGRGEWATMSVAERGKQLLDSIVLGHKSKFINTRFLF
jgi:glyceraldehyde-3-phosphate dehydrogenase (NADP+)